METSPTSSTTSNTRKASMAPPHGALNARVERGFLGYLTRLRADAFFRAHPSTHTYALKSGLELGNVFECRKADALVVVGTANGAKVDTLLSGTDYVPILTDGGDAIASLWIMNYADTSAGPYRELVVTFSVSRTRKIVHCRNRYSLLEPLFDREASLFAHQLVLNSQPAIDVGRELMGLDKLAGALDIMRVADTTRFGVKDAAGATIVDGEISVPTRLSATISTLGPMARGVGRAGLWSALQPELAGELVTRDVLHPAELKRTATYIKSTPSVGLVPEDAMRMGAESELGRFLISMEYRPNVASFDARMLFAMVMPGR